MTCVIWMILLALESLLGLGKHFLKGTAAIAVHDEQAGPSPHHKRSLQTRNSSSGLHCIINYSACSFMLWHQLSIYNHTPYLTSACSCFLLYKASRGPGGTRQVLFSLEFTCHYYKPYRNSVYLYREQVCVCVWRSLATRPLAASLLVAHRKSSTACKSKPKKKSILLLLFCLWRFLCSGVCS